MLFLTYFCSFTEQKCTEYQHLVYISMQCKHTTYPECTRDVFFVYQDLLRKDSFTVLSIISEWSEWIGDDGKLGLVPKQSMKQEVSFENDFTSCCRYNNQTHLTDVLRIGCFLFYSVVMAGYIRQTPTMLHSPQQPTVLEPWYDPPTNIIENICLVVVHIFSDV